MFCLAGWLTPLCGAAVAAQVLQPTDLHVATNGNDHWSGRLAAPNAGGTDGPLASLAGARDAIRAAAAAGALGAVTVHIRGGVYRMEAPFVLEPQDSGTAEAPVVYEAAPGERPVFSGGRVITGFRRNGPLWEGVVPEVKAGRWYFRQLFVNGQRRQRARSPNDGYHRIAALIPGPPHAQRQARRPRPVRLRARRPQALGAARRREPRPHALVGDLDPSAQVRGHRRRTSSQFAAPLKEWWSIGYWEEAQRYYVENALELLDQPGEWYLNRETGVLSYWPMPGETTGRDRGRRAGA